MTRVPAHTPSQGSNAKPVEVAISQLIQLMAQQAAREMGSDASDHEENHQNAAQQSAND